YLFKFLFSNSPYFFNLSTILFTSLAGIFAILFIRRFLNIRTGYRTWNIVLFSVAAIYAVACITRILNMDALSSKLTDIGGLTGSLAVYVLFIYFTIKGNRPARFLLLAWTIFLAGL